MDGQEPEVETSLALSIREPLEQALHAALRRMERLIARVWVVLAVSGIVGGAIVAATVARRLGVAMVATSLPLLVLFVVVARRLERCALGPRLSVALALAEGTMPWLFFAVLFYTQGAAYALSSWVPPMLFAALMVAWVARLRTLAPLLIGASGAVMYLGVYFLIIKHALPVGPAHLILHDPPMQISRAATMVLGGIVGTAIARELRRAIARADARMRSEELFGKYRLLRRIGAGGGGVVHEALYCPEGGFERRVAVKQLHAALLAEPAVVEGFRAEAELGARLAHPNVVTIHDFGRHQGAFFMAMEYVDGMALSRLASRMRKTGVPFPAHVVGHVGRGVLGGLDHAHDGVRDGDGNPLRILHRDVCPQNVLVSRIGEVKLTDFGIARVLGRAENASTRTIAGHEAYMAPEQIEGRGLVLATDLFAVGVVLWELLAGRRLFARDNPAATLMAVMSAPAEHVTALRPELDPAWDAFFVRALARPPDERFATARAMLAALRALPGAVDTTSGAALGELCTRFASAPHPAPPPGDDAVTVTAEPTKPSTSV
jgi:hypothetical protein